MKRRIAPALLLTALLTACAAPIAEIPEATPTVTPTETVAPTPTAEPTPATEEEKTLWGFPIDATHDAFEVPTGGRLGTVLVTVEKGNEVIWDGAHQCSFSVWTASDLTQPIQVWTKEFYLFHFAEIVDINFDGYMDFGYQNARGSHTEWWHFWRWDEEQGQFVAEPALDEISLPEFDEEAEVVTGLLIGSIVSRTYTFHRWMNGELVCVREIGTEYSYGENMSLQVWDFVDGNKQEVFYKEYPWLEGEETFNEEKFRTERDKWYDLAYHGTP